MALKTSHTKSQHTHSKKAVCGAGALVLPGAADGGAFVTPSKPRLCIWGAGTNPPPSTAAPLPCRPISASSSTSTQSSRRNLCEMKNGRGIMRWGKKTSGRTQTYAPFCRYRHSGGEVAKAFDVTRIFTVAPAINTLFNTIHSPCRNNCNPRHTPSVCT